MYFSSTLKSAGAITEVGADRVDGQFWKLINPGLYKVTGIRSVTATSLLLKAENWPRDKPEITFSPNSIYSTLSSGFHAEPALLHCLPDLPV